MTLRQQICRELKIIRKNEKLMQKEVAAKLGITRNYNAHVEDGDKNIPIDKLEQICNTLNYELTFKLRKI